MNRETQRFETLVLEDIARLRQEKLEFIGKGVETEIYRHWTGYIRCLNDMAEVVAAAHKKIDQD